MIVSAEEALRLYLENCIDDTALFNALFSAASLEALFTAKFAHSTGKGTDRLNGFQFAARASFELAIASEKCRAGDYRFAPYLEVLKAKGRHKLPRLIGIPTIRDRVVLSQLNRFLAAVYPDRVPRNVAGTYVREIAEDLAIASKEETWVCCTDIRTFYDAIQRDRLLQFIAIKVKNTAALHLIRHSLLTPTVPKNTRRKRHCEYRVDKGIPQGLATSNILASIYMRVVDEAMKGLDVAYYRYVDDVLMYGDHDAVQKAYRSLSGRLKRRGLSLHSLGSGKTQIEPLEKPFSYLGYRFVGHHITVRESTVEGFLQSIAAKFSDFRHNKARRLEKFKYLDESRLAEIFLSELNERITGAISEKKRYGWIAYFSQINDLSLLHRLDHAIEALFSRLPEFGRKSPPGLRTVRRAYWEMKFNPTGGYVRDYDQILTRAQRLKFLTERGRVSPAEALTDEQIDDRYEKYVHHILAAMHADEGGVYA